MIHSLTEERDGLVKLCEKTERSLAKRRAHVKKLIAIIRHERKLYRKQGGKEQLEIPDEELEKFFEVDEDQKDGKNKAGGK